MLDVRGHVFVMHGDLTKLACDAVLVPTDADLLVQDYWDRWVPSTGERDSVEWEGTRVTKYRTVGEQRVRYVNTGTIPDQADVEWLAEGVREGLGAASQDCRRQATACNGRERPLVGMPMFGVSAGGYDAKRGEAIEVVLREAKRATEDGLDVVLVCRERSDYAAVQSRRLPNEDWSMDLTEAQLIDADRLGEEAEAGGLALFLGAGVSRSAGLPSWSNLLLNVAIPELAALPEFRRLVSEDPPRAASILHGLMGEEFDDRLGMRLSSSGHAVAHGLLASLRVQEVVTTNVDSLYEMAAAVPLEGALSVLPWDRALDRRPWLLKIHGDIERGDLVFTEEDHRDFPVEHGVLGAVLQALLVTRHLVFVGYSLRDKSLLSLVERAALELRRCGSQHVRIGTVLALTPREPLAESWQEDIDTVAVGAGGDKMTSADTRMLEIFLDRMAWRAARHEVSWLLDERYGNLVVGAERELADVLRALSLPDEDRWNPLRTLLEGYGKADRT